MEKYDNVLQYIFICYNMCENRWENGNGSTFKRQKSWSWELSNDARTFRSQLELMRRFEGFRSRCRTFAECIYLSPARTASTRI